jgi:hypothetical protein
MGGVSWACRRPAPTSEVKDLRLVAAGEEGELFGSVSRIGLSQLAASVSASSQLISSNSPEPRGPLRFSGARSRAGE